MSTTPTPPPSGEEQRLTFRLLSYWNRIRGDKPLPALADVNIQEIQEMWYFTFTISLGNMPEDHSFHYFGSKLADMFGNDYSGEMLESALKDLMIENTIGFYEKVVAARAPVSESSSFYLEGKEARYRSLIVPLSSDGQTIDYLLGTTNYKIFDA